VTQIGTTSGTREVPGLPGLAVSWAARTDIGRVRERNEDSVYTDGTVFTVADGMGGHLAGDLASTAVVKGMAGQHPRYPVHPRTIFEALVAASDAVRDISTDSGGSSGSTVTGVALTEDESGAAAWLVYNIGDSRVYVYAEGTLTRVTHDHSVVQELLDAGRITVQEASIHPDRNAITRAIGFNMSPKPDFWLLNLVAGMRFVICSDGLSKEVPEDEICEILQEQTGAQDAATALLRRALAHGGADNISVIVIAVDPAESEAAPSEPRHSAAAGSEIPSDAGDSEPKPVR
jgi:protein phosphatase